MVTQSTEPSVRMSVKAVGPMKLYCFLTLARGRSERTPSRLATVRSSDAVRAERFRKGKP